MGTSVIAAADDLYAREVFDTFPIHGFNASEFFTDEYGSAFRITTDMSDDDDWAVFDPDRYEWRFKDAPLTVTVDATGDPETDAFSIYQKIRRFLR